MPEMFRKGPCTNGTAPAPERTSTVNKHTLPAATLGQAWNSFWGNLFNFNGRSTRAEYWWMALIGIVFNSIAALPLALLPGIGSIALSIMVAILTMALYVRRFHDVGLPTWTAVAAVSSQLLLTISGLALLALGFLPSIDGNTINPDKLRTDQIVAGGICLLIAVAINIVILIVTLLPSQGNNRYGPQRAGKIDPDQTPEPEIAASPRTETDAA